MTKLKVQAQHLQPGDILGSGEIINRIWIEPNGKVTVALYKVDKYRSPQWNKYTMINVERPDKIIGNEITKVWIDKA